MEDKIIKKTEINYMNEPYVISYSEGEDSSNEIVVERIEKIIKVTIDYNYSGEGNRKIETAKIYDRIEQQLADDIIKYTKENSSLLK